MGSSAFKNMKRVFTPCTVMAVQGKFVFPGSLERNRAPPTGKNQGGTDGASLARSRLAELLALSASCEALPVFLLLRWGEAAEKWASDFLHLHQKNMYIRWRVNAEGRFVFSAVKTSQGGCCSCGLAAKIPRSRGCFLELLFPGALVSSSHPQTSRTMLRLSG